MDSVRRYGGMIVSHAMPVLGLLLLFLFIVRPVVQWVTSGGSGEGELLQHLPKTVGELEREYAKNAMALPFRDRASQLLASNHEASSQLMKNWLNQQS